MRYLLDVNVLLAAIWIDHSKHDEASRWLKGKQVALCPLVGLAFLRISTNPKVFGAPMNEARSLLELFLHERDVEEISDDLPVLQAKAETSQQVTDAYLVALAAKHGHRLATFDRGIVSSHVELIG